MAYFTFNTNRKKKQSKQNNKINSHISVEILWSMVDFRLRFSLYCNFVGSDSLDFRATRNFMLENKTNALTTILRF